MIPPAASAFDRTPVAAYSFDEGEGEVAEDLAGEHDGALEGTEWAKGKYGAALYFDGEGDFVEIPDSAELQLREEFTLEAWVRPDHKEDHAVVISKEASTSYSYQLFAGGEEGGVPKGFLAYEPSGSEEVQAKAPLQPRTWNHLALTYDGANLRIYVNGELHDTELSSPGQASVGPLLIGANQDEEDFEGRIDEVRVYERALDEGEIATDKGAPIQTAQAAPVAAYSFDAGEGEVAEDLAGEHDGALEGTEWAKGKYGAALYLDGNDDYVEIPDSSDLQLSEEFTLEVWVRPDDVDDNTVVISKEASTSYSYQLFAGGEEDGVPVGFLAYEPSGSEEVEAKASLRAKTWNHLALTYDGANLRLYVNGELVDTELSSPGQASTGPLILGGNDDEEFFEGRIDEVRVYERALEATEVAADSAAPIETPSTGPVAAYSFDAGEGEVAEDLAGEHDGALEGTEWAKGKYGSALYLDGNDDYVEIPDSSELQLTEEFTLEAWVRPDGVENDSVIISKEAGSSSSYQLFAGGEEAGMPEGRLGYEPFAFEDVSSEKALRAKTWNHLALTHDGSRLRLYVNGELVDTDETAPGAQAGVGPLVLGGNDDEEFFKGRIDEVRVYERALDAVEVGADRATPIETPQTAPVAAYSFDAGEGEVAEDLAGEHDGTLKSTEWVKGKYGSAVYLDGNDDYVEIPDSSDLQLTEEFTLEAWVRPDGVENDSVVISKEASTSYSYQLFSGGEEAGMPEGRLAYEPFTFEDVSSEKALRAKTWNHLALTHDGSRLRLYVNGELVDTDETAPGAQASVGPLILGGNDDEEFFKGRIDEVRVYERALDPVEVGADRATPIETPQTGPVAAYSFDAGEGEVAEDLAGEHDGALEGTEWAKGKYGSALYLDGNDDYVEIPDSSELQLTEEFTLTAWVRPDHKEDHAVVISKEASTSYSYQLFAGGEEDGVPEGFLSYEPSGSEEVQAKAPLQPRTWNHLTLTYDGANLRLYVNGELHDTELSSPGQASVGPLILGGNDDEEFFEGRIDEVRVYERALGESELRQIMNIGFPRAITEAATEAEANSAILNGVADANGGEAEYFFEYGPTESYGSVVTGEDLGSDREEIEISEAVIDLVPETTYHYRLVAESLAGTAYGEDRVLTTTERTMTIGEEEELEDSEGTFDLIASESKAGPGDFYGMMWSGNLQKMKSENAYEAMENAGAKMLRLVVIPGDQTRINEAFAEAAKHDITILPYIGHGPFPKASTENAENWVKYGEEMVEKYGPGSSFSHPVKTWEIWNEPNMPFDSSPESEGDVNPEGFAEFLEEMSKGLRSAAKGEIQILAPGLYGYRNNGCHPECHLMPRSFLKRMDKKLAELEYSNAYDAISLHPYIFKIQAKKDERKHAPRNDGDVKRVSKAIKGVITAAHSIKPGMPLWITELGFPVANPGNKGDAPPVTNPIQGQLVRATFSMMQSNRKRLNIAKAIYYNVQDQPLLGWEHHSGLLTVKGKARPAWTSYSDLAGGKPCPHLPC